MFVTNGAVGPVTLAVVVVEPDGDAADDDVETPGPAEPGTVASLCPTAGPVPGVEPDANPGTVPGDVPGADPAVPLLPGVHPESGQFAVVDALHPTANINPHDVDAPLGRSMSIWTSQRDAAQLVRKCLEAPESLKFDIFYSSSDNLWGVRDISHAEEVVGYSPEDKAEDFRK